MPYGSGNKDGKGYFEWKRCIIIEVEILTCGRGFSFGEKWQTQNKPYFMWRPALNHVAILSVILDRFRDLYILRLDLSFGNVRPIQ